jgi:hypothetical protein
MVRLVANLVNVAGVADGMRRYKICERRVIAQNDKARALRSGRTRRAKMRSVPLRERSVVSLFYRQLIAVDIIRLVYVMSARAVNSARSVQSRRYILAHT